MSTPLRSRLTLTTLTVLLVGMGLAAVLTWLTVERFFLNSQRENLLAQARLTANALQGESLPENPEPYNQTMNVAPGIHSRLLWEQDAVVLGLPIMEDSVLQQVPSAEQSGFVPAEDLILRPEIDSALNGVPATAVRQVASAENQRVLYAAAPIYTSDDGLISGIVYLATPLPAGGLPIDIILQLLGAILIAALLATLTGNFLARRIAHPLEKVAISAQAVATGDLEDQIPPKSGIRELDDLSQVFNSMTSKLRQSEQAKNAFIADVTHELRTPLTVINGTIETLEDGALDDIEGRGPLLASMQSETKRLIRLVNDLLLLTRADAGVLNLKLESVDLGELARARCKNLFALAEPRRVALNVEVRKQAKIKGDADRLIQILDNLLNNAIRHAPEDSSVNIRIQQEGEEILCAVSNQGAGIPAQHLPFIFERFYRVESSRKRHGGESGLGLAIVHSLVSAQGGHVVVDSVEGEGATITFWLPTDENCHPTA